MTSVKDDPWVLACGAGVFGIISLLFPAVFSYSAFMWFWGLESRWGVTSFPSNSLTSLVTVGTTLIIFGIYIQLIISSNKIRNGKKTYDDSQSSWKGLGITIIFLTIIWIVMMGVLVSGFWGSFIPGFGLVGIFISGIMAIYSSSISTIPKYRYESRPTPVRPEPVERVMEFPETKPTPVKQAPVEKTIQFEQIPEVKSSTELTDVELQFLKSATVKQPEKARKTTEVTIPENILTEADLDDLRKTEDEIDVEEREFMCVVHKGPIDGNIYLCPHCKTLYCERCAAALDEKGEKCWSCGKQFKVSDKDRRTQDQQKIQQLEAKIANLKNTVQNLDETFYSGAIGQEEYKKMRDSLTDKIGILVKQIEGLRG